MGKLQEQEEGHKSPLIYAGAKGSKKPVILAWDLECSGLNANGGFIICGVLHDVTTNKQKVFRIDKYPGWRKDPTNDLRLVQDIRAALSVADVFVTYYGKRFDLPFLNTRIMYWRSLGYDIDLVANIPHIDLYDTAKRKLRLHSNRLQVVSDLLGNGDKTPLELPVWLRAAGGHKPSVDYVVKHCIEDARILAKNYVALRPLIPAHPHLGLLRGGNKETCPNCGSESVQSRGTYATEASIRRRLWCRSCGKWGSVPDQAYNKNKKGAKDGRSNTKHKVRRGVGKAVHPDLPVSGG